MSDNGPDVDSRHLLMQPVPAQTAEDELDLDLDHGRWLLDLGQRPDTAERPDPATERLDATTEWPAPDPLEFAEEETNPAGFAPVGPGDEESGPDPDDPASYPPASDPFDDPAFTSAYPLPGWTAPPDLEPLPGASRRRKPLLLAAAAAVALAGLVTAFLLVPRGQPDLGAASATAGPTAGQTAAADPGGAAAGARTTLAGPRDGLDAATFDLLDSATTVQLTAADLGDDLYRVSTPGDGSVTPSAEQADGTVKLRLRRNGGNGSASVTIQLSSAVRWSLRLDGGTKQSHLDLTGADLAAVDLNGGASRIELTLPDPHGLLPVRMTGGVDQFQVSLAGDTPVRVQVRSGAGEVTLAGATHKGIAPGRSFTANGWTGDTGIDLLAEAGLATLTVTS